MISPLHFVHGALCAARSMTLRRRTTKAINALADPLERRTLFAADVLTYHNDNARDGLNPNETILTSSSVSSNNCGKLFTDGVDGAVYAQPLVVSGGK